MAALEELDAAATLDFDADTEDLDAADILDLQNFEAVLDASFKSPG